MSVLPEGKVLGVPASNGGGRSSLAAFSPTHAVKYIPGVASIVGDDCPSACVEVPDNLRSNGVVTSAFAEKSLAIPAPTAVIALMSTGKFMVTLASTVVFAPTSSRGS